MLNEQERDTLLSIAATSIRHGLDTGRPLAVDPLAYPAALQQPGASFVTLELDGRLRGCIGSLEAVRPLVHDVAANAFAAAFSDPRFPPLSAAELPRLHVSLSLLGPAEAVQFDSEADLTAQLQPGVDGLILEAEGRRGTFLPSVWESLPDPAQFLRQLKLKAGLPADYWSNAIRVSRYRTESFGKTMSNIKVLNLN